MESEIIEAVCRQSRLRGCRIEPLSLPNPFGKGLIGHVPETDSTMELADELWKLLRIELKSEESRRKPGASPGAEKTADTADPCRLDAVAVRTDYQRKGRGRTAGRSWESERGKNLMATVALPRETAAGQLQTVPLRAGLAVLRLIRELVQEEAEQRIQIPSLDVSIKWPNDVLIGGRKVCGILCESRADRLLIGPGLNVNQQSFDFSGTRIQDSVQDESGLNRKRQEKGQHTPTSLYLELRKLRTQASAVQHDTAAPCLYFMDDIFARLLRQLHRVLNESAEVWHKELNEHLYGRGRTVRYIAGDAASETVEEGILAGTAEDGALRIERFGSRGRKAGEILLYAGELVRIL